MAWIALILAGLGEVAGVLGLNRLNRRRDWVAVVLIAAGFTASLLLLAVAIRSISMGTAYAVWTGIGTIGATLAGMLFYGESRRPLRLFFLALVAASAAGLKLLGEG